MGAMNPFEWRSTLLLLGFSSGIPFLLTLSTLSFRLAESGISPTIIGLFVCVTLPYALKFLWAPWIDRSPLYRKHWLLGAQSGVIISLCSLAWLNPWDHLAWMALCAFCVSFFAATQDIVIEIIRINSSHNQQYGLNTSFETIGFRLGMLLSGAGALYLADIYNWTIAYLLMASCLLCIMLMSTSLNLHSIPQEPPERSLEKIPPRSILQQFLHTLPPSAFIPLILFIFFFKYGDILLNAMSAPFLYDCGYSKIEYANITKVIGLLLMLLGSILGGCAIDFLGHRASILICVLLQSISCCLFWIQSMVGYHLPILTITVGIESLCSGICGTVFIAYLSSFCHKTAYTGTFFTGLYSMSAGVRIIISVLAGPLAEWLGWNMLFSFSALVVLSALWAFKRLDDHCSISSHR